MTAVDWALKCTEKISPAKKLLLVGLAWVADSDGVTFVGHKRLAERIGQDPRWVRDHISGLAEAGLISRYRRHRANGSRTTDLIVLNLPRTEPLSLNGYSGIVGELESGDVPAAATYGFSPDLGTGSRTPPRDGFPSELGTGFRQTRDGFPYPLTNYGETNCETSTPTSTKTLTLLGEENDRSANGNAPKPCWSLSPDHEDWAGTYRAVDPGLLESLAEFNIPWAEPPVGRVVLDFWRDLHWHMEAELTPSRKEAITTALKHYPVRIVLRAIAAGLTDPHIQGDENGGPYDKLETLIAITSKRDNVERLGRQVPDAELGGHISDAENNRTYITRWRAGEFDRVDEEWRFKNRHRLQRDGKARYNRFMKWQKEVAAA